MTILRRRPPCPLVSDPEVSGCDSTDCGPPVFGTPTLLKRKADNIPVGAAPPPPSSLPLQPSLPPPVAKCPRCDRELVSQMWGCSGQGHSSWTHCVGLRWPPKRLLVLWQQQCLGSRG